MSEFTSQVPLPIDNLLVPTAPEAGPVQKQRITKASQAQEIYRRLKDADRGSANNRVAIQAQIDGAAPYSQAKLTETGQANRCNLNFGEGAEQVEHAQAAYVELLAVEKLITVNTRYGDKSQRGEWEDVISQEWSNMVRDWPAFDLSFQYCALHFIVHGVAVCFFENELDWRWRVSPFGDFLIPRRTLATQDGLEVACASRSYQVHELYKYIENPEIAKEAGWDVELVRLAISKAQPVNQTTTTRDNWEKWQIDLKDNDIYVGETTSEVKLIHIWVQEFDGKVSHLITTDEPDGAADKEDKFLYKKTNRFANMAQAFTFFTYGIGTNGHYHGIRGLGHKIFPLVQYSNRLLSQEMDSAMLASTIMIQPESEEAMDNMQLINYGSFTVTPPGMKFIERAAPNLMQSVEPALNRMGMMVQKRAGSYTSSPFEGGGEKTRFEVSAQLEYLAKLNVSSLSLFYAPWGRHLREVFRRSIRKDYIPGEPGGLQVANFRLRCVERGVPLDAIFQCDVHSVKPVQAVGAGSGAARTMVYNEMLGLSTQFDDVGKNRALRAKVASIVGWPNVDLYVPAVPGPRPTNDDRFATLENADMEKGTELPVFSNDIHPIHARIHIGKLAEMVQQVEQGEDMIAQLTPAMLIIHTHATQHVEAMAGNPVTAAEAGMYRQQLQQIGEIVYNGVKHLQKLQKQQQESGGQAEGQPQGPTQEQMDQAQWSRNLEKQVLENNIKLQQSQLHFEQKLDQDRRSAAQQMSLTAAKAQQDMALKDAQTAAQIRRTSGQ